MDLLYSFSSHWSYNIISFVIAIVGLVSSYVLYRKSLRDKGVVYWFNHENIISNLSGRHSELQLKFLGYGPTIDNCTISRLSFVNSGRKELLKADIPRKSPFVVRIVGPAKILEASVTRCTTSANNVIEKLNKSKDMVTLTFDYFNEGDGFELRLLHTGNDKSLHFEGKIIGSKDPKQEAPDNSKVVDGYGLLVVWLFFLVCLINASSTQSLEKTIERISRERGELANLKTRRFFETFQQINKEQHKILKDKPNLTAKELLWYSQPRYDEMDFAIKSYTPVKMIASSFNTSNASRIAAIAAFCVALYYSVMFRINWRRRRLVRNFSSI